MVISYYLWYMSIYFTLVITKIIIANTKIGLNPNNSVIKRCLNNFVLTRKTHMKITLRKCSKCFAT